MVSPLLTQILRTISSAASNPIPISNSTSLATAERKRAAFSSVIYFAIHSIVILLIPFIILANFKITTWAFKVTSSLLI